MPGLHRKVRSKKKSRSPPFSLGKRNCIPRQKSQLHVSLGDWRFMYISFPCCWEWRGEYFQSFIRFFPHSLFFQTFCFDTSNALELDKYPYIYNVEYSTYLEIYPILTHPWCIVHKCWVFFSGPVVCVFDRFYFLERVQKHEFGCRECETNLATFFIQWNIYAN